MAKKIWEQYPLINQQLNQVSQLINDRIQMADPKLQTAIKTMLTNGGKYLRPSICLLFARLGSHYDDQRIIKVASSLEILHTATLVHDDIIDDSPKRRGRVSIQAQFGKDVAVYAGDYLFTVFFDLITETMANSKYLSLNAETMRLILNGELDQMNHRFDRKRTVEEYLKSVKGKTAALFRLAALEGAEFGQASASIINLAGRIGENIGISFQIVDDLLDYSNDHHLNKPVLEDLATGVYSLPLILAMSNNPSAFTVLDKGRQLTEEDMQNVGELVRQNNGINDAQALAKRYTDLALADIRKLPDGQVKDLLKKLTQRLLKRSK